VQLTRAQCAWETQIIIKGQRGIACAHSLPPWRWSPLFHCRHVLKECKARKAPPEHRGRRAPPGRQVRLGPRDRPDRKEKKARPAPPVLPACLVRREPVAVSVRQDLPAR
jgi:hypothetical protein